jgi:hypothetical protein
MLALEAAKRNPHAVISSLDDRPLAHGMRHRSRLDMIEILISTGLIRIRRIEENGRDSAEVDRRYRPADPAPIPTTDTHVP